VNDRTIVRPPRKNPRSLNGDTGSRNFVLMLRSPLLGFEKDLNHGGQQTLRILFDLSVVLQTRRNRHHKFSEGGATIIHEHSLGGARSLVYP
jgi:hypothetical protein